MSPRLIGIIGVGSSLAALILRLDKRIDDLASALGEVRGRLSPLEGLIEGLFRPQPVLSPAPDRHDKAT